MNKKNFLQKSLKLTGCTFLLGLILIFLSLILGAISGSLALSLNGGSMDTSSYHRVIETVIGNFRIIGGIISFFGGIGFLMSGYVYYTELE